MVRRGGPLSKSYDRNKKLIAAFLAIVFLFVVGHFIVPNFLSLNQILITVKLASFIALFSLCQMIVMAAGEQAWTSLSATRQP